MAILILVFWEYPILTSMDVLLIYIYCFKTIYIMVIYTTQNYVYWPVYMPYIYIYMLMYPLDYVGVHMI